MKQARSLRRGLLLGAAGAWLLSCSKPVPDGPAPAPSVATPASAPVSAVQTGAPPASVATPASAPDPSPSAAPAAPPAASAKAKVVAPEKPSPASPPPTASAVTSAPPGASQGPSAPSPPEPPAKPVFSHVGGSHYTVDLSAPGDCKVGARCVVAVVLRATEGYHINDAYPYKLVANDTNVDYLGKEGKTFSKSAGDFAKTSPTSAQMSVAFAGKSPGAASVSGTFKMSVCSESNCQIESQPVAIVVPVR